MGVCSTCPDLIFENRKFALTGTSKKFKRSKIIEIIKTLGGEYSNSVTGSCDYLIVGSSVNPSWAYACYGRKVEQALDLRKKSHNIIIAHENDFWDSAMDNGIEL